MENLKIEKMNLSKTFHGKISNFLDLPWHCQVGSRQANAIKKSVSITLALTKKYNVY